MDTTENSTTSNVSNNGKQKFHEDDQSVSSKFEVDMTSLEREDPVQERLLEHVSQYTVPSQSQIIDIDNENTIESSDLRSHAKLLNNQNDRD